MSKCLYCYQELEEGQTDLTSGRVSSRSAISSELDGSRLTRDFHPACARKFFGSETVPVFPYTRDNMSELARQVIRTSASTAAERMNLQNSLSLVFGASISSNRKAVSIPVCLSWKTSR